VHWPGMASRRLFDGRALSLFGMEQGRIADTKKAARFPKRPGWIMSNGFNRVACHRRIDQAATV
jgi:hypothetical protein